MADEAGDAFFNPPPPGDSGASGGTPGKKKNLKVPDRGTRSKKRNGRAKAAQPGRAASAAREEEK